MSRLIGLDFETYSGVSLPDHGLNRYMDDKSFMPLLGAVAWRDGKIIKHMRFDFVRDYRESKRILGDAIGSRLIVAHNAGFEQKVLDNLVMPYPSSRFIDSAVVARAAGGGGHLEAAAPQLLDTGKLDMGKDLIRLFSIPGKYQEENGNLQFDERIISDHPEKWSDFGFYCEVDASLGLQIAEEFLDWLTPQEMEYQAVTQDMNRTGWCVDRARVEEMQRRYLENLEATVFEFRLNNDAADLNLNSLKQMKEWCAARGVRFTSFDEKHVERYAKVIEKKLATPMLDLAKAVGYQQVAELLRTKKALGGSSLKKLKVMLDTISVDYERPDGWRLKDQYLHVGAGQTWRTTGRSVQMQNLKQLTHRGDMEDLDDPAIEWDNDKLAENIRQLFTATDPNGRLLVGDFKSVDSRGLAYLAGEQWKLDAYRAGEDVYSRLSARMFDLEYINITETLRKPGKVGELSCGYGAAGGAVKDFAAKMHIELTEGEATKIVWDWRDACPMTTALWDKLNEMLHSALTSGQPQIHVLPSDGLVLTIKPVMTPDSLERQHPGARSMRMLVTGPHGSVLKRYFHGCYEAGRNIRYYKPSDRKTGDLWRNTFTNPKTKQLQFYELYGGKLAGILTQSFCRELFFESLVKVQKWARFYDNVALVGQFHDEIVLDLKPGAMSLYGAEHALNLFMSKSDLAPSFPLAASVKSDYRYTK